MYYLLSLLAGLVAGFALARWIYQTPPKPGDYPKALTSDGDLHDNWDDAVFVERTIAANRSRRE